MIKFVVLSLISLILLPFTNVFALDTINALTPEQINEVEKKPLQIMSQCNGRIDLRYDAGNLCDAFSTYLKNKCDRLDNLGDYCSSVIIFNLNRAIQKSCMSNPPLATDTDRIERCLKYVELNETYSNIPLKLTLNRISFDRNEATITTEFSVFNPNAKDANLISISYNVTIHGDKIASGGIGDAVLKTIDCPTLCFIIESGSSRDFKIPLPASDSMWSESNLPFSINGIYRFQISSSAIESKQFNFTSR
jgi:hypothetical protein